jgi:hypothetical protein
MKFSQFLSICVGLFVVACNPNTTTTPTTVSTPTVPESAPMVGNDQDAHGCKASAGYTWSVVKNECIRIFESGIRLDAQGEKMDKSVSAFVVFKSDDEDQQAELYLPTNKTSILLAKIGKEDAGTWKNDSLTLTQWKGMYTLEHNNGKTKYQGHAMSATPNVDVEALLQGKWQSVEDSKSTFVLKGKVLTTYYNNKKVINEKFSYVADCSGNACNGGSSKLGCYSQAGEFDITCYSIISISDTELKTSMAGGTGNTLTYKKVK